jgi:hypothetical protein
VSNPAAPVLVASAIIPGSFGVNQTHNLVLLDNGNVLVIGTVTNTVNVVSRELAISGNTITVVNFLADITVSDANGFGQATVTFSGAYALGSDEPMFRDIDGHGYSIAEFNADGNANHGIQAAWNDGTGVLTLSGIANSAEYQEVLRMITAGENATARETVSVTIQDAAGNNNTSITAAIVKPTGDVTPPPLVASGDNATVTGTAGNDELSDGAYAGVTLNGGAGDDEFRVGSPESSIVSGGNGFDSLVLIGNGINLDLSSLTSGAVTDIELLDLGGTGANVLSLSAQDVLDITSAGDLFVRGGSDDTVNLSLSDLFVDTGDFTDADGHVYDVWIDNGGVGTATLYLEQIIGAVQQV